MADDKQHFLVHNYVSKSYFSPESCFVNRAKLLKQKIQDRLCYSHSTQHPPTNTERFPKKHLSISPISNSIKKEGCVFLSFCLLPFNFKTKIEVLKLANSQRCTENWQLGRKCTSTFLVFKNHCGSPFSHISARVLPSHLLDYSFILH